MKVHQKKQTLLALSSCLNLRTLTNRRDIVSVEKITGTFSTQMLYVDPLALIYLLPEMCAQHHPFALHLRCLRSGLDYLIRVGALLL